jgi:capsular polysaccharide biosynthesis protein
MSGILKEQIIPHNTQTIYTYETAIIPSLRNTDCLLDEESLAFYLRERYGTRSGARKLFVSPLGWTGSHAGTHRIMLNEEQLAQRLVSAGFRLVQTHTMFSRQQIEAFSSADLIVGASGSAMFNVVFSHPGTKIIDIESEPHWIFVHTNLFGSGGLDDGIFKAEAQDQDWSVHHKPLTVNIEALMARIADL